MQSNSYLRNKFSCAKDIITEFTHKLWWFIIPLRLAELGYLGAVSCNAERTLKKLWMPFTVDIPEVASMTEK